MARSMVVTRAGRYAALVAASQAVTAGTVFVGSGMELGFEAVFIVLFAPVLAVAVLGMACRVGVVLRWRWARRGMLACLVMELGIMALLLIMVLLSPALEWFGVRVTQRPLWLWLMEIGYGVLHVVGCVWMMGLLRRREVREEFG